MHSKITTLLLLVTFWAYTQPAFCAETKSINAIGSYAVDTREFVYAKVDDLELLAIEYRPKTAGQLSALIDVHGGAWNLYDRTSGDLYNRALASAGIYVLAIDFRQGPNFKHPLGSRDTVAAIRYLKSNANQLNIDKESIGLIGSSSGGHLAMLAGLKPNDDSHQGTPFLQTTGDYQSKDTIDARVNYVVALWPVSDPIYRYGYAKKVGRDRLVSMHDNYFGNEQAMREASIPRLLNDNEAISPLPDLLVIQAGEDGNIPPEMTFSLMDAYQNKNGNLEYAFFPGEPHAFGHKPSANTTKLIEVIRDYISRQ